MQIDVITKREELNRLRENWDDLYQKDPEAQFFLSWTFLSSYMRRYEDAWSVLAARSGPPGSSYIALLPLRLRTRLNKKTGICHNELNMAGNYAADYAGILCAPGFAERAIPALARHLLKMNWAKLHLENLRMSEKRRRLLIDNLADRRLTAHKMPRVNKTDNVDNCICPAAALPGDWDSYLEQKTSSNTRQKIRRFLRKLDGSGEFRITHADATTIDRDIGIILEMWRIKWAPRKGNLTGWHQTSLARRRIARNGSITLAFTLRLEIPSPRRFAINRATLAESIAEISVPLPISPCNQASPSASRHAGADRDRGSAKRPFNECRDRQRA